MTIHVPPPPNIQVCDRAVAERDAFCSLFGLSDFGFDEFRYSLFRPDPHVLYGPPEIPREHDHGRGAMWWHEVFTWMVKMDPLEAAVLRVHQEVERKRKTGTLGAPVEFRGLMAV